MIINKSIGETIKFANSELAKYLKLMRSSEVEIELGLLADFGIEAGKIDPAYDDRLVVSITDGKGYIAGSNPRSVLYGVYAFLEACGCKWIRQGKDGDYIPKCDAAKVNCQLDETADMRYRGFCIEGAVSLENMLDNVDWAVKMRCNSYFLEFEVPYIFFDRYYGHRHNPYKTPESRTIPEVAAFSLAIEREISKRGMLYHAMGHGWTCKVLGLIGLGWDKEDHELTQEQTACLAEINGERKLFQDIPLNTNLCYGNPKIRTMLVDAIADYAEEHQNVSLLHFWLADDYNNQCECELCRDTIPTDFFIMMLNELDEKLTERKLDTKIVFLNYMELLWPPIKEKLNHPDRFAMLFAPISRSYSESYNTNIEGIQMQPYQRNKTVLPHDVSENIMFLREWQKSFQGDAFTYEYHFMWDCYNDPGFYKIGDILSKDIKKLPELSLCGMIEDQSQRNFFPTGYPQYLYCRTLWSLKTEPEDIAKEYFAAAYGEDGEICRIFMKTVSELFDPVYIRGEKGRSTKNTSLEIADMLKSSGNIVDSEAAEQIAKIPALADQFRPVVIRNLNHSDPSIRLSYEYMKHYLDMLPSLAYAFYHRACGDNELALYYWKQVETYVQINEDSIQNVLDVFELINVLGTKFKERK